MKKKEEKKKNLTENGGEIRGGKREKRGVHGSAIS
jgi:hypothetical protein